MENILRTSCAILSFIIPLVGIGIYVFFSPKKDAQLFGIIGIVGVIVYFSIGLGFI